MGNYNNRWNLTYFAMGDTIYIPTLKKTLLTFLDNFKLNMIVDIHLNLYVTICYKHTCHKCTYLYHHNKPLGHGLYSDRCVVTSSDHSSYS